MKLLPLHRLLFALALSLATLPASAWLDWRRHGVPDWATPEDIAAEKHLRNLCLFVGGVNEAPPNSHNYRYVWLVKLAQVAQAEGPIDSAEEVGRLQRAWQRFDDRDLLGCDSVQFDVANGSILKYAAIRNHDAFVHFAAEWKLSLTKVDKADNRTILDYLQYHMARARGTELEKSLRQYYEKLRKAGAKHRSELP